MTIPTTYDQRSKMSLDEATERLMFAEVAIQQLERALAAAQADAERYRWLRDNPSYLARTKDFLLHDSVDAAIDAAIKEKP